MENSNINSGSNRSQSLPRPQRKSKSTIAIPLSSRSSFFLSSKLCTSCLTPLGLFLSRGSNCPICGLKVCKKCKVFLQDGSNWNCLLCSTNNLPNNSTRIKRSFKDNSNVPNIKRSWSISSTSNNKGSPVLKAYIKYTGDENIQHRQYNSLPRSLPSAEALQMAQSIQTKFQQNNTLQSGGQYSLNDYSQKSSSASGLHFKSKSSSDFPSTLHPFNNLKNSIEKEGQLIKEKTIDDDEEDENMRISPCSSVNFIQDFHWDYYDYEMRELQTARSSCERSLSETVIESTFVPKINHQSNLYKPKLRVNYEDLENKEKKISPDIQLHKKRKHFENELELLDVKQNIESDSLANKAPKKPERKKTRSNSMGSYDLDEKKYSQLKTYCLINTPPALIRAQNKNNSPNPTTLDSSQFSTQNVSRPLKNVRKNRSNSFQDFKENIMLEDRKKLRVLPAYFSQSLPRPPRHSKNISETNLSSTQINYDKYSSQTLPKEWRIFRKKNNSGTTIVISGINSNLNSEPISNRTKNNYSRTYISDEAKKLPFKEPYPSFPSKFQTFSKVSVMTQGVNGGKIIKIQNEEVFPKPLLPLYRGQDERHGIFALNKNNDDDKLLDEIKISDSSNSKIIDSKKIKSTNGNSESSSNINNDEVIKKLEQEKLNRREVFIEIEREAEISSFNSNSLKKSKNIPSTSKAELKEKKGREEEDVNKSLINLNESIKSIKQNMKTSNNSSSAQIETSISNTAKVKTPNSNLDKNLNIDLSLVAEVISDTESIASDTSFQSCIISTGQISLPLDINPDFSHVNNSMAPKSNSLILDHDSETEFNFLEIPSQEQVNQENESKDHENSPPQLNLEAQFVKIMENTTQLLHHQNPQTDNQDEDAEDFKSLITNRELFKIPDINLSVNSVKKHQTPVKNEAVEGSIVAQWLNSLHEIPTQNAKNIEEKIVKNEKDMEEEVNEKENIFKNHNNNNNGVKKCDHDEEEIVRDNRKNKKIIKEESGSQNSQSTDSSKSNILNNSNSIEIDNNDNSSSAYNEREEVREGDSCIFSGSSMTKDEEKTQGLILTSSSSSNQNNNERVDFSEVERNVNDQKITSYTQQQEQLEYELKSSQVEEDDAEDDEVMMSSCSSSSTTSSSSSSKKYKSRILITNLSPSSFKISHISSNDNLNEVDVITNSNTLSTINNNYSAVYEINNSPQSQEDYISNENNSSNGSKISSNYPNNAVIIDKVLGVKIQKTAPFLRRESPEGEEEEFVDICGKNVSNSAHKVKLNSESGSIYVNPLSESDIYDENVDEFDKNSDKLSSFGKNVDKLSRSSPDGADGERAKVPPSPSLTPIPFESDEEETIGDMEEDDEDGGGSESTDSWVEEVSFEECNENNIPVVFDRTLYPICEESEFEETDTDSIIHSNAKRKNNSTNDPSGQTKGEDELEKYYNFTSNNSSNNNPTTPYEESEFSDTVSERSWTASSMENYENYENNYDNLSNNEMLIDNGVEMACGRLENYFLNLSQFDSNLNYEEDFEVPLSKSGQNTENTGDLEESGKNEGDLGQNFSNFGENSRNFDNFDVSGSEEEDSVGSESEHGTQMDESRKKKVLKHHRRSVEIEEESLVVTDEEDNCFEQDGFDTIKKTRKQQREAASASSASTTAQKLENSKSSQSSKSSQNPKDSQQPDSPSKIPKFLTNSPKFPHVSRSNSFNWSSDEEVNVMMSKLRALFKNLATKDSKTENVNAQNRDKDSKLVYLESELVRLMEMEEFKKAVVETMSSDSDEVEGSTNPAKNNETGNGGGGGESDELVSRVMSHIGESISTWMRSTDSTSSHKRESSLDEDEESNSGGGGIKTAQSVSSDLNEDRFSWKGSFDSTLAKRQSVGSSDSLDTPTPLSAFGATDNSTSAELFSDRSILRSSSLHHLANSEPIYEESESSLTSSLTRLTSPPHSSKQSSKQKELSTISTNKTKNSTNSSINKARSLFLDSQLNEESSLGSGRSSGEIKSARYRPPGYFENKELNSSLLANNPNSHHHASTPILTHLMRRSEEPVDFLNVSQNGVRGEIEFLMQYDYKSSNFEVFIKQCRDLAPSENKKGRNESNPYVKAYLLPDRSKSNKRKTKTRKGTLNPVFGDKLRFQIPLDDVESRCLELSVWHSASFGKNEFLGQVLVPLAGLTFEAPKYLWYPLSQQKIVDEREGESEIELVIALKWISKGFSRDRGNLTLLIKEGRGIRMIKNSYPSTFVKCTPLSDKSKKQKTVSAARSPSPVYNSTLSFNGVSCDGLEISLYNSDILSTELLASAKLTDESELWNSMRKREEYWVEGAIVLHSPTTNNPKNAHNSNSAS